MKRLLMHEKTVIKDLVWEQCSVKATLVVGDRQISIRISANVELRPSANFLLPIVLPPAMKAGVPLVLPGEISPRLLSATPQIQDILNMWESIYKKIPIEAETRAPIGEGSGVACFFSGGVDSFHTALRHSEEITHLVHLHRYAGESETTFRKMRAAAEDLGKPLIEVNTNLHPFKRTTRTQWPVGPWMAGVALLLQHEFRKVYFAGSTTSNYDNLRPQGTHPLLDPLWSTETTVFFHDACEVRRGEKVAEIAEKQVAMRHLQVCGAPTYGTRNCGQCEKCVRTMLNLVAAGALERCETLPDWVDSEAVRSLDLSTYGAAYLANENLRALKKLGTQPELVAALEEALERGAVRIAIVVTKRKT